MKALLLLTLFLPTFLPAAEHEFLDKARCLTLITEMEAHLETHILKPWYPRSVDKERGGFIQDYAEDWSEKRDGNKTLVYQSRLTWMAAQVALSYPEKAKEYIAYSNHGLDFLADKMWDKTNGGLYWSVDATGKPTNEHNGEKHVYGISFALYAASVNYKATKNPKALELAQRTFDWLEKYACDGGQNGYFEALNAKGEHYPEYGGDRLEKDLIGTAYGYRSMNTHIHLLESFTAFYEVAPTAVRKFRLHAIYDLVHDKICFSRGRSGMHLYFDEKFQPMPDLDSYGHDLETAYLLRDAAAMLDLPPSTERDSVAFNLVFNARSSGWDQAHGGFYNEGTFRKPIDKEKVWWVQAEALNALLMMATENPLLPVQKEYSNLFLREWGFIRDWQIDNKNGGWISYLEADGTPKPHQMKSDQWKDPYHQGRALINVIERLKKLAK